MDTLPNFDPLDLAEVCKNLQAAREELDRTDAAIDAAEEQQRKLSARRMEIERAGRDGSAVADALLSDPDQVSGMAALLAPDLEALGAEFDAFTAARQTLQTRRAEIAARVATLEAEAFAVITLAAGPVVEALEERVRQHIEGLIASYADLAALNTATRAGAHTVNRLSMAVRGLISGVEPLAPWRRSAAVSGEMVEALTRLAKVAPGVPVTVLPSTYLPG